MAPYRSTQIFDENTLPDTLRADHRTKAGTWGVINVLEGTLRLNIIEPPEQHVLSPGRPGLVKPLQTHFVTPIGAMRVRVDFHDSAPDMAVLSTTNGKEA